MGVPYRMEQATGEDEIIALLHKGNEKALSFIFKKYHTSLFFFASQLLADSQVAEDVVAEAFIKLWEKRADFDYFRTIRSFLFISVKNAAVSHLRQANRHAIHHREIRYMAETSEDLYADHRLVRADLLQQIWQDIEGLPPMRQKIFKLIYLEGLNTGEVAKVLDISVDTVRVQKARALQSIRMMRDKLTG